MSLETFKPMAYGPIGDAVIAAEPHTEADPVGVYAAILALWSGALNGLVRMSDDRPVVVWTVLAGESALGGKGTALRVARKMLEHSISGFLEARTEGGVSSGPALTQKMWEKQEETEGTEDGTDTRVILIDQEWTENLRKQNTCPTFASRLRTSWDGDTIRHNTTRVSMVVYDPRLGFHAHITPENWGEYIKPRDAKGGSYNRLLPVLVECSKVLPYGHKEVYPDIQGLTEAYDWARRGPRLMSLSREAARRFDELRAHFMNKMADMPKHITCYVERTPEQIIRVAAVLTATERKTTISRKAIDVAWAFVQYSMRSVEKLVREDTKASSKAVKTLPDLIRDNLRFFGGKVDHSSLIRRLGNRAKADEIKTAIAGMSDIKVITGVTSGRGRPGVEYRWADKEDETAAVQEEPAPVIPEPRPAQPATLDNPNTQELMLSEGWL
ncbi:DUF3987 domain-containing protein [Streptomyces sp. WG5]|uniref:DUF3987 domain-containing protein n=1 Tax=Streptomyces sp. WG5 TaxID=3417648 RepID=UPI003CE78B16